MKDDGQAGKLPLPGNPIRKRKKIPKTVQFEAEVWEALEAHMKRERIYNHSLAANDAIKYALFPEHRDDRNADTAKLLNQILYSLNEHRRKTSRDLTIFQEILVRFTHAYFMHTHQIPDSAKEDAEVQANVRLDAFMEQIVRRLPKAKTMTEGDGT
jgi:hypothetical protein